MTVAAYINMIIIIIIVIIVITIIHDRNKESHV